MDTMTKGKIIFYTKWVLDLLFVCTPFIFSAIWLVQTFIALPEEGILGGTWLFPMRDKIHNITTFVLVSLYTYAYLNLNKLPPPVRVVSSIGFVMIPMTLNGVIWNTFDHYIRGGANALLPASYFVVIAVIMLIVNMRIEHPYRKIFNIHWKLLAILFPIFIISLYIFVASGFFINYDLMLRGLYNYDPHGWEWGFEQVMAYWAWIAVLRRRV